MEFSYDLLASRVVFGVGAIKKLATEVIASGGNRVLVLASPAQKGLAEQAADLLGGLCAGIFDQAVMHVPHERVDAALKVVNNSKIDLLVAVGGGSAIGLAKGVALGTGLPVLAIPTTYAGSEMTPIWGITRDGRKTTGRNPIVKPKTVIYDPELIVTLPPTFSATSGMNAMAHAVEALYAEKNANPITSLMAEESIRVLADGLPKVVQNPLDIEARSQTFYGSWLAASVLSTVGIALHHKLCHTLGGSFNLPHAALHTIILPYATAYNSTHAAEAMQAIGRALGVNPDESPAAIFELNQKMNAPLALQSLKITLAQLDEAAEIAVQNPYYNPRPITQKGIRKLLEQAYYGERPDPSQMAD